MRDIGELIVLQAGAGIPANVRALALAFLIGFLVLTIALVPFEFRFFAGAPKKLAYWTIAFESLIFILLVAVFLGFIFDWFAGKLGATVGILIAGILWIIIFIFIVFRTVLANRIFIEGRGGIKDARKILQEIYQLMPRSNQQPAPATRKDKTTEGNKSNEDEVH